MKTYLVYIPLTAMIAVTLEARDEKEAKELAMNVDFSLDIQGASPSASEYFPELCEWSTHERIVQGNLFSGVFNEIEAIEV